MRPQERQPLCSGFRLPQQVCYYLICNLFYQSLINIFLVHDQMFTLRHESKWVESVASLTTKKQPKMKVFLNYCILLLQTNLSFASWSSCISVTAQLSSINKINNLRNLYNVYFLLMLGISLTLFYYKLFRPVLFWTNLKEQWLQEKKRKKLLTL